MNKYYLCAFTCIAAACAPAFADTTQFAGPSVGASLAFQAAVFSEPNNPSFLNSSGLGQHSAGLIFHGSYGLPVSDSTVVLLGLDYNPTVIKSGELLNTSAKLKNAWSLSVAPGYLVNNQSLAYAKLSFEGATASLHNNTASESKNINGIGLGFGVRTELNKSTYMNVEIKHVNYKTSTLNGSEFAPISTIGTVGFGYNF